MQCLEAVWTSSIPKKIVDSPIEWNKMARLFRSFLSERLRRPEFPNSQPDYRRHVAGKVVEAAEYSGSRITVCFGLESGGEVFALRGHITSPQRFGPHALIRQGAKLVAGWQDVVEELPHMVREKYSRHGSLK